MEVLLLILLSPAKRLVEPPAAPLPGTQPALMEEATALAKVARELSAQQLGALMKINEELATLNVERFKRFAPRSTEENARQAVLSFAGDVYQGLDADSLSPDDLQWAQSHVAILSGLYGVLRPMDLIQPYRLEMGTRLATPRGEDLYSWWGDRVTDTLRGRLGEDRTVINLASAEYFKAVRPKALDAKVITPVFQDVKNGKARSLGFFVKRARGMMTRWAITHRVTDAAELKRCDAGGYTFTPDASTDTRWIFRRPQPPPVGS